MMKTHKKLRGLVPLAALVLGLAACQDAAPTGPDATVDGSPDGLTSVIRGKTLNQVDRMGFPAINTAVVIESAAKDAFNAATPADDFGFIPFAVSQLERIYAVPPVTGQAIAGLLLPDILTLGGPVFAGREPAMDVIDAILGILFGPNAASALGPVPTLASDNIDANDEPFPTAFPYLAAPHGG